MASTYRETCESLAFWFTSSTTKIPSYQFIWCVKSETANLWRGEKRFRMSVNCKKGRESPTLLNQGGLKVIVVFVLFLFSLSFCLRFRPGSFYTHSPILFRPLPFLPLQLPERSGTHLFPNSTFLFPFIQYLMQLQTLSSLAIFGTLFHHHHNCRLSRRFILCAFLLFVLCASFSTIILLEISYLPSNEILAKEKGQESEGRKIRKIPCNISQLPNERGK